MSSYLRLRQVCLAAPALAPAEQAACATLGLPVCHRDPNVAKYGLENVLFVLGRTFLEIVAPTREGTAAARFIERSGGLGGYMAIFDSDDPQPYRARADALGVRIAHTLEYPQRFRGIQLHPRDARATMLEVDHSVGGDRIDGAYWPAGAHWQDFARTQQVGDIVAIDLRSPDPQGLAAHWSRLLDVPLERASDGTPRLAFDLGEANFGTAPPGMPERLHGVTLSVDDPAAMRERAARAGLRADGDGFVLCGVTMVPVRG